MILETTTVGSFPKPEYLKKARLACQQGRISPSRLRVLEEQATREWIEFQDEIGIDILVDGEMYRGDMATYFAEHLAGFKISGLCRSYGNRYYKKPVAVSKIKWTKPITIGWFQFAQALTQRPVKGMITGPYTMMDWSFNEYYPNRRALALDLARALRQEVLALEAAGAVHIQIDEPAVSTRPAEIDIAIEAMGIVTKGVRAKTITHICYGNFERVYPKMLKIPVDQFDLEMSNSNLDWLQLFSKHPFTKEIAFGVLDVHSHKVETKEQIKDRLRQAMKVIPVKRITVDPDCGLKTRTVEEAKDKLRIMVEAVKELREEIGVLNR